MELRRSRVYLFFFLLILIFLLLRLGSILTAVQVSFWEDELDVGTIAKELVEGLKRPLWDYQRDSYSGESLVIGLVAVPFFKLFGPNLFALKMSPLIFSLSTLIVLFFFMKRHFGSQCALIASALFVFAPTAFSRFSTIAMTGHSESLFFSIGMLFAFYEFLYRARHKLLFLMLFGLLAGIGFWFYHATGVILLACLVSWLFLSSKSFFSRRFFIFIAFFLIGLTPWFIYNAGHSFQGLDLFKVVFLKSSRRANPFFCVFRDAYRLIRLIAMAIPSSFFPLPFFSFSGAALSYLYCLIVFLITVPFMFHQIAGIFLSRRDKAKVLPLALYPLFFILIYSVSDLLLPSFFDGYISFRYFTPLQFLSFLLLAAALSYSRRKWIFLVPLLSLGFIGQGTLLFKEPFGRAFQYKGYSYFQLGSRWGGALFPAMGGHGDFSKIFYWFKDSDRRYFLLGLTTDNFDILNIGLDSALQDVPNSYQPYFLEALGTYASFQGEERLSRIVSLAMAIPENERGYFYKGWFDGLKQPAIFSLMELAQLRQGMSANYHQWIYLNYGKFLQPYSSDQLEERALRKALEIVEKAEPEEKAWVYRGIGQMFLYAPFKKSETLIGFLKHYRHVIPRNCQNEVWWGYGWSIRRQIIEDRVRALDRVGRLPEVWRESALEGFKAYEKWYGIAP